MAKLQKLKIAIKTSSDAFAGTDAQIYLGLGLSEGGRIYRLPTRKPDLEVGRLDIYAVDVPDQLELQDLRGVALVNGMNGQSPAWRILWVKIDARDAEGRSWRIVDAMVERWLDVREGRAPVVLLPLMKPFSELGTEEDAVGITEATLELIQ
jgi:hypothetical protein